MSKQNVRALAATLPLALLLSACTATTAPTGGKAPAEETAARVVRVGIAGTDAPYWQTLADAAETQGVTVEMVDLPQQLQLNPALSADSIDLNPLQDLIALADYNVTADDDLVPIGTATFHPLGLYSTAFDDIAAIPADERIAVPSDDRGQARALLLLQSTGLVALRGGGSIFSTVGDIDEAASKVSVVAVDAAATATSLPDVAAAVVGDEFLASAGLTLADAIAQEDPGSPSTIPYLTVFTARAVDAEDAALAKLVEIFQNSPEIADGVRESSDGTTTVVKTPAADLVASLQSVEDQVRTNR